VLSGVLYGVYIFGIHHCRRLAPQFVVAPVEIGTVAAGVMTAVAGLGLGGLDFDLGWDGWAWMIALAVCGQALSWVLLSISSPLVPVPTTAALMLLQPLSAVVLGSLIAGERLQPAQWVGAVLVAVIVWVVGGGPEALIRSRRRWAGGTEPGPGGLKHCGSPRPAASARSVLVGLDRVGDGIEDDVGDVVVLE